MAPIFVLNVASKGRKNNPVCIGVGSTTMRVLKTQPLNCGCVHLSFLDSVRCAEGLRRDLDIRQIVLLGGNCLKFLPATVIELAKPWRYLVVPLQGQI